MFIQVISRTEEKIERCDYRDALVVKVDGKEVFSVRDDEPEDSNLGRSFSDCYKIAELMEMAYQAGENRVGFRIENIQSNDI